MALVKAETVTGFTYLPPLRQIALLAGLAASIALGIYLALWSQAPNYSLLYGGLSDRDSAAVIEALQRANIEYELDGGTGAVLVPADKVHQARMTLASQGLPNGAGTGFELLERERSFGTSQFLENARFQRALEGELARTISSLRGVHSARVHLAVPKRSVFVRDQVQPSASVFVNLSSGRVLDEDRVASIVHMVASSVPELDSNHITVVNQQGDLLTSPQRNNEMGMNSTRFKYTRKLEQTYAKRITNLLTPMVGAGRMRAQVAAEVDFTVTEQTQESYNPDGTVLRSEQTEEQQTTTGGAAGIPGSLSNQPPVAGTLEAGDAEGTDPAKRPTNASRRATRNFELDKKISHTRQSTGKVQRLSVAVVLDHKQTIGDKGEVKREPWTDQDIERFTQLVKETVGFSEERGDSVNVMNVEFQAEPEPEAVPEPGIMEQPWVWTVARQAAGAIGILVLMFGVLKPVMRGLAEKGVAPPPAAMLAAAGEAGAVGAVGEDQVSLGGNNAQTAQLGAPGGNYEEQLNTARSMVAQDPKLVAQVVKNWVADDA